MVVLRFATLVLRASVFLAVAGVASGQDFPGKPIRLIIGFPPGGGADNIARLVVPGLNEYFGQQVVIDNRPGASGNIALELLAKSPSDGYTLLLTTPSVTVNPALYRQPGYDPVIDFAPVALMGSSAYVLVVSPSLPVKSIKELVALAKAKPRELYYSSGGNGSAAHLSLESFRSMVGIQIVHVPYKGIAPALISLISGEVQFSCGTPGSLMPFVKEKRLRALAVTSAKRSTFLPELPSISEAGVPGYEITAWYGLLAPARTPRPVIDRINTAVRGVIAQSDVKSALNAQSFEVTTGPPEQFSSLIKVELVKWQKVVMSSGMKIE